MKLKILIEYLVKNKYRDSIAPRKEIAKELEQELTKAGIAQEDHLIAVSNMFPRSL